MKKFVLLFITLIIFQTAMINGFISQVQIKDTDILSQKTQKIVAVDTYTPNFMPYNIKELMTISPIFTPDNALDLYVYWINRANTTLNIQIPYFRKFDSGSWETDSFTIIKAIANAKLRGVNVQIQINLDSDNDNITSYFNGLGISVKGMGNLASNPDKNYISTTHNKLVIIDEFVVIISSINFSEEGFISNREAGMIIQNTNIANYFTQVFNTDWSDGEFPLNLDIINSYSISNPLLPKQKKYIDTPPISHTSIPQTNFTGVYNVTVFTNPDNANDVIFKYLNSAKESIYVSMYTISRPEFNNTLIKLKKSNPKLDIQVLISNRRVGTSENEDTYQSALSLVDNLIPVYNSTTDPDKVNGLYHNKYWIIDGKHVFVYSGNWSPRSVSPELVPGDTSYTSGEINRDMGIAVHDSSEIASFFLNEVWKKDVAVSDAWELPIGVKLLGISTADVISESVSIQGAFSGINAVSLFYKWNNMDFENITSITPENSFKFEFDSTTLSNGINLLTVKVVTNSGQEFFDSVNITVANYASSNNWRVLVTEVFADPSTVPDNEGEFFEITNSFPFAVLLEGWITGDDKSIFTFSEGYQIDPYTSIIFAKNKAGFESAFSVTADFEFGFTLKNVGDYVYLKNSNNEYVDVVAYGIDSPDGSFSFEPAISGESLQRIELHIDTDSVSDFTVSSPTPKSEVPQEPLLTDLEEAKVFFPFNEFISSLFLLIILRKTRRINNKIK